MKKNLVKVLTLALAAATIAGMSTLAMPVSAEETPTISVTALSDPKASLTVKAYQVVKVTSEGYELCDKTNAKITDPEKPTSEEVITIAKNIRNGVTTLTAVDLTKEGDTDTYSATGVDAGLYVVIATGSDAVVYNPALVAWNVKTPRHNSINMGTTFAFSNEAYLKASSSGFNKSIVGSSMPINNTEGTVNTEGDVVAYDTDVTFKLDDMSIPYYSDSYEKIKYEISDELDPKAFKGIGNVVVKVGDDTIAAGDTTYSLTGVGANSTSFVIDFKRDFIRDNHEKSVEVTYTSHFTNEAGLNYAENKNTATLRYSNDPKSVDENSFKEITDTTYHYTFGIDADVDAQDGDASDDTETYELNKVTAQAGGNNFEAAKSTSSVRKLSDGSEENKDTMRSPNKLAGATFGLYTDAATSTTPIQTYTSDVNGHIQFKGLDTGTYYMKETKAPDTYSLNTDIYKIVISATLDEEGIMKEYTIKTYRSTDSGKNYSEEGSAKYTNKKYTVAKNGSVTNTIEPEVTPVEIINTPLVALPATGGEGTIAITIGGALGMAGFLTLYIANKKKKKAE